MSVPRRRLAMALLVVLSAAGVSPHALGQSESGDAVPGAGAQDMVEAYLERLGLKKLLAEHLASILASAPREQKVALAERLAKVYVELLASASSNDDRRNWEKKSDELLKQVPEADGSELRLNLSKAIYLRAEEVMERGRLRLATTEELDQAQQSLRSLEPQLTEIATRAHRRVEQLEKVEEQGDASEKLQTELADARRIRSLAFYYAGWCKYYVALGSRADASAADAMKCFGWLLNAQPGKPASLERISPSLLRYEHVARAAVGVGLCAGLRGNDTEAIRWLDTVEQADDAPASVKSQIFSRRMVVLAGARRWADLEQIVRRARKSDRSGGGPDVQPLSVADARLLAVLTLEADRRVAGEIIQTLARAALADLVARGEVAHVLDLVEKYGTAPIGDQGFIVHFVRGVKQYDSARDAHKASGQDQDEPCTDAGVINQYRAAADLLSASLTQSDAESYKVERARAALLAGLAKFYAGDLLAAADSFFKAWEISGKGPQGEEPLWLTVLSLDKASQAAAGAVGSEGIEKRRNETAALYLQTYPESPKAARLLLMQVSSGLLDDEEALKVLGGVAKDSPVYEPARRQIARILYNRFRAAQGNEKDFAAMRFVGVAEEVLASDRKAATQGTGPETSAAADRVVLRVRQLLDALLSVTSPDPERAESCLQVLKGVAAYNNLDLGQYQPELLFRQLQLAMARSKTDDAEALAERLRAEPRNGGEFGAAADRLLYRSCITKWKGENPPADAAAKVVRYGVRVIDSIGGNLLADPAVVSLYSSVAAAAVEIWHAQRDDSMRDLSMRLDKQILEAQPRAEESLRRLAETSEAAGDPKTALSCWVVIATAAPSGSTGWFEATYHTIRLLKDVDAAKARAAMDQHKVLYPTYGPAPWGEKMLELDKALTGVSPPPAPGPGPGAPAGDAGSPPPQKGGGG